MLSPDALRFVHFALQLEAVLAELARQRVANRDPLLTALADYYGDGVFTADDALHEAERDADLHEALASVECHVGDKRASTRLGVKLRDRGAQRVGENRRGAVLWRIV